MVTPHRRADALSLQIVVNLVHILRIQFAWIFATAARAGAPRHAPLVMTDMDHLWFDHFDVLVVNIKEKLVHRRQRGTVSIRPFFSRNLREFVVTRKQIVGMAE